MQRDRSRAARCSRAASANHTPAGCANVAAPKSSEASSAPVTPEVSRSAWQPSSASSSMSGSVRAGIVAFASPDASRPGITWLISSSAPPAMPSVPLRVSPRTTSVTMSAVTSVASRLTNRGSHGAASKPPAKHETASGINGMSGASPAGGASGGTPWASWAASAVIRDSVGSSAGPSRSV
jgi:hypothetical protein